MPDTFTIADLMWSVQRALIGEVTANTAAVTCSLRPNLIVLRCYVFNGPTPDDEERLSAVAGVVIADFPEPYTIAEECVRYEPSGNLPECLERWAFMRAEVEQDALRAES